MSPPHFFFFNAAVNCFSLFSDFKKKKKISSRMYKRIDNGRESMDQNFIKRIKEREMKGSECIDRLMDRS